MRALRPVLLMFSMLGLAACTGSERPRSNARVPACSAPICADSCACDTTFSCDPGCSDCDPECGNCRTAEGNCRQPVADAGTNPPVDAGPGLDGGGPADTGTGPVDAGPCAFPPAQPEGAPCCGSLGVDACSLGLFCDAYDGRTQTVCYRLGSRDSGETCNDPTHCASGNCINGVCALGEGDLCTGPGQCTSPFICHPEERRCLQDSRYPCHPSTHEGCAVTESCIFTGEFLECLTAGTAQLGQACTQPADCARGLVCAGGPDGNECRATCDPNDPSPVCPPESECQRIPLGPLVVGLCI